MVLDFTTGKEIEVSETVEDTFTIEIQETKGWAIVKHLGIPVFDIMFSYKEADANNLAEALIGLANGAVEDERFC